MSSLWRFCKSARIPGVQLHTTGVLMRASVEDFNQDKAQLRKLKKKPDNEAKWDAWKSQDTLSQEAVGQQYVDLKSSPVAAGSPTGSVKAFQTLLVTTDDGITTIRLNRPQKKNAITVEMYREIVEALDLAGKDDSIITVMTGSGDYYCSGNDLNNFSKTLERGVEKTAEELKELLRHYVKSYIDFPKPLAAVVNGPAVGVSVTALGLFDIVYATESASEMLLFNKKLTATQAYELGLVTEVFPDSSFHSEVWTRLKAYAKLPPNSLALSKQLVRQVEKDKLHAVNDAEVERLMERWLSDECMQAIMSFFQAKAK
ncbi:hypothetical protein PHYPO_G00009950 [Pangasianodon hypophthalmus]|uniref:Enoyl-CoA delta isomerase 2, mitochondrial n=1 Tax=Pangasianodon hypophthalmus TaxID=310915 RepID=A0A5N5Q554_PANHP|nr:hypothetical protein PHYPO_G00009950 [Pangasianodon hypophthalmus]